MGNVVQNNKFEQGHDHWYWGLIRPSIHNINGKKYARIHGYNEAYIGQQLYGLIPNHTFRMKITAKCHSTYPVPVKIKIDSKFITAVPDNNDIIDIWFNWNLSRSDPTIVIYGHSNVTVDVTDIYVSSYGF